MALNNVVSQKSKIVLLLSVNSPNIDNFYSASAQHYADLAM